MRQQSNLTYFFNAQSAALVFEPEIKKEKMKVNSRIRTMIKSRKHMTQ